VKDFSKKAAPLNDLLKKSSRFQWTPACQSAFDELKTALQSPHVLALPNDSGMYCLDTDASDKSIGAVLSQVQDGLCRPIIEQERNELLCLQEGATSRRVLHQTLQAVPPVLSLSAAHGQLQCELAAEDSRASRPECPMTGAAGRILVHRDTAGRILVHRAAQKRHQSC